MAPPRAAVRCADRRRPRACNPDVPARQASASYDWRTSSGAKGSQASRLGFGQKSLSRVRSNTAHRSRWLLRLTTDLPDPLLDGFNSQVRSTLQAVTLASHHNRFEPLSFHGHRRSFNSRDPPQVGGPLSEGCSSHALCRGQRPDGDQLSFCIQLFN